MTRHHNGACDRPAEVQQPRTALPLTARQRDVLDYVRLFIRQRGFPPTVRDAATEFGIQHNAIIGHLKALEAKQYIVRDVATARGIRVVESERHEFSGGAGI